MPATAQAIPADLLAAANGAEQPPRKKKNYKTVPFAHIAAVLAARGWSESQFADAIGMHTSTVAAWREAGKAPAWTVHTCAGIMASTPSPEPELLLLRLAPDKAAIVKPFLDAVGVSFARLGAV